MIIIDTAKLTDLDNILTIQDLCYFEIEPESSESMASKIIASPDTCFVAKDKQEVWGYLLSIPALLGNPPQLDSKVQSVVDAPDCLYLHDLAIHPKARGKGIGQLLIHQFIKTARYQGFRFTSLISIQNSVAFWKKYGFQPVEPDVNLKQKLLSYGENATYMEGSLSS